MGNAAKKRVQREIELDERGALPRWPEDDVRFVCARLVRYGKTLVSISTIVRDLGLDDSTSLGATRSPEYFRVRKALFDALRLRLVRRAGEHGKWGLPDAALAKSA